MNNIEFSLRKIEAANWLLLLFLCTIGVLISDSFIATSILAGGAIANISFGWLKKDLTKLFSGSLEGVKARFFVRYYLRFALVVSILFLLIKGQMVHVFGLLVGLSTVLFSILLTLILQTKKIYFNNMKEAS